jgi:hypothetical protein
MSAFRENLERRYKMVARMSWVCLIACMAVSVVVVSVGATQETSGWVPLFDGKTLKGWSVHSGFAKYTAQDGTIVGSAVQGSPNSFLCTDKEYADFILEFEVKVDPALNSGMQFRSHIAKEEMAFVFYNEKGQVFTNKIPPDRVYGYQAEIATAAAHTNGGIYDEARRAFFIADIRNDPKAGTAFKDNEWNKYRIECKGNSMKTWVNDVPCANFKDSLDAKGVFGLQVHGLGKDFKPYQVRWRNIRIKEL